MAGLGSNTRATAIRKVVRGATLRPPNTGGTTAPASAGPRFGVGQGRPVPAPKPRGSVGQNRPVRPNAPKAPLAPLTPQGDPNALPIDPVYDSRINNLNTAFGNTNLSLNQQELATKQAYGLDPQFSDPTQNPYTKAALLEQSYLKANRGSTNSYASSGQLYAGSLSNALDTNRASHGQSYDELNRAYLGDLAGITTQRNAAQDTLNTGTTDAYGQRVADAIANKPDPATAPAPVKPVKVKKVKPKIAVSNRRVAR